MRFSPTILGVVALGISCSQLVVGDRAGFHLRLRDDPAPPPPASTEPPPPAAQSSAPPSDSSPSPQPEPGKDGAQPPSSDGGAQPSGNGDGNGNGDGKAAQTGDAGAAPSAAPSAAQNGTASNETSSMTASPSSFPTLIPNINSTLSTNGTRTNGTISPDLNKLPLTPVITPGIAIAGVIMLLTGAAYAVIGIKNKWLHVFLSSGYLTALAVVVLIIYVMNPPITDAVQGAYVVAAVLTGLVFGFLSVMFIDVTEGLGCLLGGFCLSMWLLVLKPGGLLTSTGGKAVFIAAFTISIFALSFSHYTRPYGLIVSTSFGGATIVVLGMDCFSRAGLKEFWVYLWNLNNKLFPLGTDTYPQTRGIRVEIAAIIFLFLIGIVSQLKLWKVVKEKRDARAAERARHERDLDQLEEDVGRRVEQENDRERAEWEAVYGERTRNGGYPSDSGLGDDLESMHKGSTSGDIRGMGKHGEVVEMTEMYGSRRTSQIDSARHSKEQDGNAMAANMEKTIREEGEEGITDGTTARNSQLMDGDEGAQKGAVPPPPEVIPLPFTVPTGEVAKKDDDASSVATVAETSKPTRKGSKRRSMAKAMKRFSTASSIRYSQDLTESSEALVIPHDEEDRSSSVAGTVDDFIDEMDEAPTRPVSYIRTSEEEDIEEDHLETSSTIRRASLPATIKRLSRRASTKVASIHEEISGKSRPVSMVESTKDLKGSESIPALPQQPVIQKSLTSSTDPQAPKGGRPRSLTESDIFTSAPAKAAEKSKGRIPKPAKSVARSERSGKSSLADLQSQMNNRVSNVVLTYRANEWAKHLGDAERPEPEELVLEEPIQEAEEQIEAPARLDLEGLQQTPETAQIPPVVNRANPSTPGHQQQQQPFTPSASAISLPLQQQGGSPHTPINQTSPSRRNSQISLHSNISGRNNPYMSSTTTLPQAANVTGRGIRSSSNPGARGSLTPNALEDITNLGRASPSPGNTLLGRRDTMLRNKVSNLSLGRASAVVTPDQLGPSDSASIRNARLSTLEEGELTLAERRRELMAQQLQQQQNLLLLQQQRDFQTQQLHRQSSTHMPSFGQQQPQQTPPRPAAHRVSTLLDPHTRATQLAAWRESVKQDLVSSQVPEFVTEARRIEMMHEKQREAAEREHVAVQKQLRMSVVDERMRKGDMHDLHREAMRRMQAGANRKL